MPICGGEVPIIGYVRILVPVLSLPITSVTWASLLAVSVRVIVVEKKKKFLFIRHCFLSVLPLCEVRLNVWSAEHCLPQIRECLWQ